MGGDADGDAERDAERGAERDADGADPAEPARPASPAMWGAALALVAVTLALTVAAGPVTRLTATAAADLVQPEVCVVAVLVTGEEG